MTDTETVTVRANQATSSWADGEVLEGIERTSYIDRLLGKGVLSLVSAAEADTPESPGEKTDGRIGKPKRSAPIARVRAYAEQEAGEPLPELTLSQLWALIDERQADDA